MWPNLKPFVVKEYDDYLENVDATAGLAFHADSNIQDETLSILKDFTINVTNDRENLGKLSEANVTLHTLSDQTLQDTLKKVEGQIKSIANRLATLEKKQTGAPTTTRRKKFSC